MSSDPYLYSLSFSSPSSRSQAPSRPSTVAPIAASSSTNRDRRPSSARRPSFSSSPVAAALPESNYPGLPPFFGSPTSSYFSPPRPQMLSNSPASQAPNPFSSPPRTFSTPPVASTSSAAPVANYTLPHSNALRACKQCRQAHAGCDNNRPCTRCVIRGRQDECIDEVNFPFPFRRRWIQSDSPFFIVVAQKSSSGDLRTPHVCATTRPRCASVPHYR
jgi:hypothetical protein